MKLSELARSSFKEIRSHKARSAMTSFSLAIGIAAMVFTFSQTSAIMKRFRDAQRVAGMGRLMITPRQGYISKGRSPGLTSNDAEAIRREYPELSMVYARHTAWGTVIRVGTFHDESGEAVGVGLDWPKADWVYTLHGRLFNERDFAEGARVCLLVIPGGWIKKPYWARWVTDTPLGEYLSRHDPLGKEIRLNGHVFKVVGALQSPPHDRDPRWFNRRSHDNVMVPLTTFQQYLTPRYQNDARVVEELDVDTGDAATTGAYIKRIQALLLRLHRGEDDVEIKDFRQVMDGALRQIRHTILSIMVIGLIAILASGIGIMNVTLATIFSRVREIGIRRALGATRADIVWQFVTEASALGLVGGVAGTLLGAAGVAARAASERQMVPITTLHVVGALLIALATGFLFSLYPAYQASRLDPVESLRYE